MGINQFSDWTAEERSKLTGTKVEMKKEWNIKKLDASNLSDSVDWRTKGAVTPVKNQAQCGSCWSFSTTGALEGAHFVASGNLVSLSEQQFVDCDTVADQGCNGGLMDNAFEYAETHPVMTESDYPYIARRNTGQAAQCSQIQQSGVVSVKSYHDVPAKNISQMKAALDQQPVSVAIEADQYTFQMYHSGVITS